MIRYRPSELIERLQKLPNDKYVTFSFLSSWFDNELYKENIKHYNLGLTKGLSEMTSEVVSEITMIGIRNDVECVYKNLLDCKKKLYYSGYALGDAPFHGWYGEPLRNIKDSVTTLEDKVDILIALSQTCLGISINPKAWEEE